MSSEKIIIDVRSLSKRYEIYPQPSDRLKQLVVPPVCSAMNRGASSLGVNWRVNTPSYFREFWALHDISFQVRKGETLGIIGRNGSGKSTLLQILAGTLAPTAGVAEVTGRVAALLELGSGFNPDFTGRENVFLNGRILGLNQRQIEDRYDQIVEFADIGNFIDEPVKTYSSGMFLRLAFAVQAHIDASIVIIDEALAVGDVFFRQKCYTRLEQLKASGAAILLVSHSMPDIEQYCERALLLDAGNQRFLGEASEAAKNYYLFHQQDKVQAPRYVSEVSAASKSTLSLAIALQPPVEAFVDLSNKVQVANGQARCTGLAMCNAKGEASRRFRQGERAQLYYEFELTEPIGVPICGIVIKNDRGIIVHGKNSWQFDTEVPTSLGQGSKIVCQQQIQLELAPGEYVFEIGLASVTLTEWENRQRISHEEMSSLYISICQVPNVGVFSVGIGQKNGVSVLTHHGVANLPGALEIAVQARNDSNDHH